MKCETGLNVNRHRLVPLLLPTLLLVPARLRAQTPGALTWRDCLAIAAEKNPDLAAARLAERASRASYYGSFNALLPQLSLANSYSDSKNFSSASSSRWRAQASASMNLFDMSQVAGIKSASASLARAQAQLRLASVNLRFNLRQAFAQLLFAQKNVDVSVTINALRHNNAQLVTLRYDSGRESKGNMLRSKAQAIQSEVDLAQARRDLRASQKSLQRHLGLGGNPLAVQGELEAAAPPDLPDDVSPLLPRRPDVGVQEAAVRVAEAGLSQARSSFWPSLSATYTRSRLGNAEFPAARYDWTFAGVLTYPFFGSGPSAAYFAVSAAQRGVGRAEEELRAARAQAVLDLESAWAGYAGAVGQVQVRDALLEADRQRNDEADVRYASGLLSYDNWEIIATARINSERQAIQAMLGAVNAQAAWDKAVGLGLVE